MASSLTVSALLTMLDVNMLKKKDSFSSLGIANIIFPLGNLSRVLHLSALTILASIAMYISGNVGSP